AACQLGHTYWSMSDFDRAEPLFQRVLEARRRVLGADDPDTLMTVYFLTTLYAFRGELDRAEALLVPALEASRKAHGDRAWITGRLKFGMANVHERKGHPDKAESLLLEALKWHQIERGDNHPSTLATQTILATHYLRRNRLPEAERHAEAGYRSCLEVVGKTN